MYVCSSKLSDVLLRIDSEVKILLNWFIQNGMVANPDKFLVIFLGNGVPSDIKIKIGLVKICSLEEVKLLGVTIDRKHKFPPSYTKYLRESDSQN